ncbi:MAG: family 20 glycosylhydrolase [Bacteroidetes bacterium]|nr:family 20 glycosylhydrolase [Bacteroidota bacterium]MBS1930206.1 family 20 glycosylhydrolase [Bacteroidota bacterium]
MKKLFLACLLIPALIVQSQEINIIPEPVSVRQPRIHASFYLNVGTQIISESSGLENSISYLNDYLYRFYHFKLTPTSIASRNNVIHLNVKQMINTVPGAYIMSVREDGITITGNSPDGVFYGIQSLLQMLPVPGAAYRLPVAYCEIIDYPRFPYRGMHLDCGRHFFNVDFIKKYIDFIALHKMNYFHWHLTDDQGWRIEIKKYPRLTQIGAWRNGTIIGRYPGNGNDSIHYGGYYTQEQIKEIVKYAADRYITVIPEIEMPGHASAALASYPFLGCTKGPYQVQQTWGVFDDVFCAGNDSTYKFLDDVLDEVMALFPSKYIHIGGDECPKTRWKTCPICQKRIRTEKLRDEHALQSYFIHRIEKYVNSKGRMIIGWDEILEGGLAPNATVMSWRGEQGGIDAARQNHDVIMTPGDWCYFDHSQSEHEDSITIGGYLPLNKVYNYEPVPDSLIPDQAKHILGAQGNVWTEYMSNDRKVEYMIFPRMSALSEVLWSSKRTRNWDNFEKKLLIQFKRYDLWNANYSRAYFELKTSVLPSKNYNGVLWKIENKFNKRMFMKFAGIDSSWGYTEPQLIQKSCVAIGNFNLDNRVVEVSQVFHFNKATGKKITLTYEPYKNYYGDGAFTLVNGIQNDKGMARPSEMLGFLGTDCEAVIDLGKPESISNVTVHTLKDIASWIWPPKYVEVFSSPDGLNFTSLKKSEDFKTSNGMNGTITVNFPLTNTRFVKVLAKNQGVIQAGNPGAGYDSWLFEDEIEVN